MLKEFGIIIYVASLLVHAIWGVSGVAFWVALYHILQNSALSMVCAQYSIKGNLTQLVINRGALCYFSSAAIFYVYALATNQLIYFSNFGDAGIVLSALIVIAVTLTLIDYYAARRRK